MWKINTTTQTNLQENKKKIIKKCLICHWNLIIHHLIRPHLKGYHFLTIKIKRLLKFIQNVWSSKTQQDVRCVNLATQLDFN
jgi:hypothetical protein